MSKLPGFVSEYDPFDIMGITSMTSVSAATTQMTITITPTGDDKIFLFGVSAFFDGASSDVAIIYDGTTKIGVAAAGENVGHPYVAEKAVILDGNLVVHLPAGAAGKGYITIKYLAAEPPSVLYGAKS